MTSSTRQPIITNTGQFDCKHKFVNCIQLFKILVQFRKQIYVLNLQLHSIHWIYNFFSSKRTLGGWIIAPNSVTAYNAGYWISKIYAKEEYTLHGYECLWQKRNDTSKFMWFIGLQLYRFRDWKFYEACKYLSFDDLTSFFISVSFYSTQWI